MSYQRVLVIPAFAEPFVALQRLVDSIIQKPQTLLLWVSNYPSGCASADRRLTLETAHRAQASYPLLWRNSPYSLHDCGNGSALLLLDMGARGLPVKEGVGLARKLGADSACWLIEQGQIADRWFYCSDADVELPLTYWLTTFKAGLGIYPFRHLPLSDTACQRYEASLHHYVNGLKAAGSPYAWHTIGSLFVMSTAAYLQVRGFPKRAAGEDFYLLNKLVKVAPVVAIEGHGHLILSCRRSHRVPFGTGVGIGKLAEAGQRSKRHYPPHCFQRLRQWLSYLNDCGQALAAGEGGATLWSQMPPQLVPYAEASGLQAKLSRWSGQRLHRAQADRQLMEWFDGFKTLKFIHQCRDSLRPASSQRPP